MSTTHFLFPKPPTPPLLPSTPLPLLPSPTPLHLHLHLPTPPSAGRRKKPPSLNIPDSYRRRVKQETQKKYQKLAETFFYRLKNPHKIHADNFTQDELNMMGLGYDRMVRFMKQDDPNLKHPFDWYKYGEFGPYSWRGVVIGDPVRGRMSDECVSMFGEVRDHEEWERIEQHEMSVEFEKKRGLMDKGLGFKYFWVFVRHPKWKVTDSPWEQWTLVCEVMVESRNERLDKWNLMGRFGNKVRALITQCAAWFRPDIIYVKRPVYQCRFEPQDEFFNAMVPLLDPETERDHLFELEDDEGRVLEMCTYFGGLCKIVKVRPKAFVDDVVKGYEKLSDEKKVKCLGFLLKNHPLNLLHPWTKEWKAKLEEMELGCDAPDDDDVGRVPRTGSGEEEFTEWVEDEDDGDTASAVSDGDAADDDDGDGDENDVVIDGDEIGDDELGIKEDDDSDLLEEEDDKNWEEELKEAMRSNEAMENLARRSVEKSTAFYERQIRSMEEEQGIGASQDRDETVLRGKKVKLTPEEREWVGYGRWRKRTKKSKIPPELFLRAAVRPFTYKNLVKEIVLTRHAILDGEVGGNK